jgi:PAS domain S-box-containing protein
MNHRRMLDSMTVPHALYALLQNQPPGANAAAIAASLFGAHRGYFLVAALLVIVQGTLIGAMFASRARRRQSEARNNALLRAIPDLMLVQRRDGVFLDYHVRDPSILLAPPEHFIGKRTGDILPPPIARQIEAAMQRLFDGEEPVFVEYEVAIPSGDVRYFEARLVRYEHDKVLTIVRDVTERRAAEAAVRDEQMRHRLATTAGGVGVWDWNLATNQFYADSELKERLGHDESEALNHLDDWRRLVHPDDLAHGIDVQLLVSTPATTEFEQRMVHKDGTVRWFLVRGAVGASADGLPSRVIGTCTDITDRKKAAEALDKAEAELVRAARLATLGELTGSIAHELAQPLTAITANAHACLRLLERPALDIAEFQASLRDVLTSGEIARGVLAHTRRAFGNGRLELVPIDLTDVVNDVRVILDGMLRLKNIAVEIRLDPDVPTLRGDPVQLRQVLLNLMTNAIQSMDQLEPGLPRRLSVIANADAQGNAMVTVVDTGVGLGDVLPDRLFSGSYTTKPDGMGWGLSISRSIVQAHGGQLWAKPNDERGAVFSFTVPPAVAPANGSSVTVTAEIAVPPTRGEPAPPTLR